MDAFIRLIANTETKYHLYDFAVIIRDKFYNNIDTIMMNDMMHFMRHPSDFIVNHEMLFRYGIVKQTSMVIAKTRLTSIGLEEMKDYINRMDENGERECLLTPNALIKILLRCDTEHGRKYIEYILFIQQVFLHYTEYELKYDLIHKERMIASNDGKIDEILQTMKHIVCQNDYMVSSIANGYTQN